MEFTNNYKVPPIPKRDVDLQAMLNPSIPFDFNFVYPVKELQNDRLRLVPFVPALFAQEFLDLVKPNPELFTWLPFAPWETMEEFLIWYDTYGHSKSDWIIFAVLDLSKGIENPKWGKGQLAGMIALLYCEPYKLRQTRLGYSSNGHSRSSIFEGFSGKPTRVTNHLSRLHRRLGSHSRESSNGNE